MSNNHGSFSHFNIYFHFLHDYSDILSFCFSFFYNSIYKALIIKILLSICRKVYILTNLIEMIVSLFLLFLFHIIVIFSSDSFVICLFWIEMFFWSSDSSSKSPEKIVDTHFNQLFSSTRYDQLETSTSKIIVCSYFL